MDGNRRFARSNKLGSVIRGHMKGFEQLAKVGFHYIFSELSRFWNGVEIWE